jgi:hypothetical protein
MEKDILNLPPTDKLAKKRIIRDFLIDFKLFQIRIGLNYEEKQINIISDFNPRRWTDTMQALKKRLKEKNLHRDDILDILDSIDNNHNIILDRIHGCKSDEGCKGDRKEIRIRKYSGNGRLPVHESIIVDGRPVFLKIDKETKTALLVPKLETDDAIFFPADTPDSLNPLPYILESIDELNFYVDKSKKETIDSLHSKIESILRKYIRVEEHYITILAADILVTHFFDRLPYIHCVIIIGDNGSGKNSALLVFKYLGYRVFYISSASAANYITVLGNREEGQVSIAEDEAEDMADDREKRNIIKTGYCSGGSVPKVHLSENNGRTQDSWLTYCPNWFALEEIPKNKKMKGILYRSLVFRFVVGVPEYNIKDVINGANDPKYLPLFNELIDLRKTIFLFRILHWNSPILDVDINLKNRNAELTKPLIRLFKHSTSALVKIRHALYHFIEEKNETKRNSREAKIYEAVRKLIDSRRDRSIISDLSEEEKLLPEYGFTNLSICESVKEVMDGEAIQGKKGAFYSVEHGLVSQHAISSILDSKFKAKAFKIGSGADTKRCWLFDKQYLNRISTYYDIPSEIEVLDPSENHDSPTDATDATDSDNAHEDKDTGFSE